MSHQNKEVINKEEDMGFREVTNGIQKRMEKEKEILFQKWPSYYEEGGDPYYNRNFGKNSISYDA